MINLDKIPFTPEGFEKIKEELENLIKVERRKVINAIEEARLMEIFQKMQNMKLPERDKLILKVEFRSYKVF